MTAISASMSSTLAFAGHDFSAAACIDGVWGANNAWSFCHTAYPWTNPWLSVQVAPNSYISGVTIHGRSDARQDTLGSYQV